jgi:hypothetical protein
MTHSGKGQKNDSQGGKCYRNCSLRYSWPYLWLRNGSGRYEMPFAINWS